MKTPLKYNGFTYSVTKPLFALKNVCESRQYKTPHNVEHFVYQYKMLRFLNRDLLKIYPY